MKSTPKWVSAYAERILGARGRPTRMKRLFGRSTVPMLMVDRDRRCVDANTPARLAFRLSLSELRRLRIDDLTPRHFWPQMEAAWTKLTTTGCVSGTYDLVSPANSSLMVTYYAMADALPGLSLVSFAPTGWPEGELLADSETPDSEVLTPREIEVLDLAAEGCTAPMIAAELVLSTGTVRTHFEHIYEKLGVRDRAAAVAKAMRLGLIA
jgi:two-component system, NarL family, nitrate/nitrite response regulator NarL